MLQSIIKSKIIQHKYDSLTFDRETLKNTIRNSGYKHCILQTKIIRRAKSLSNKKLVEFQKNTENGVRHKVMFKQGLIDENRETCTDPSKLYPCKSCLSLKKHCDSYCDPPDRIQVIVQKFQHLDQVVICKIPKSSMLVSFNPLHRLKPVKSDLNILPDALVFNEKHLFLDQIVRIEQREKEIRFELKTMTPFSIYCTSEDDCSCLKNIITGKMEELVNRKEVEDTICNVYPSHVIVPKDVSDNILLFSAHFRNDRCFPILAYYCANSQVNGKGNRCPEDEQILASFNHFKVPNLGNETIIIDLRTKSNASKYGNIEQESAYQSRVLFTNLESTSTIIETHAKFLESLSNEDISISSYYKSAGGFLKNIQSILRPSNFIAKSIFEQGSSILVHCENGLDLTSIVVSLSKLLLDPFYRTPNGFITLLEEDWYFLSRKMDAKEIAACLIVLFLECIIECLRQHPQYFQFTFNFLTDFYDSTFSPVFSSNLPIDASSTIIEPFRPFYMSNIRYFD
ncbi:phosphatases II [Rozella allomycis CSF55]|uniref:Phosphatases II n=1 Tax=Rozella allomycis (strain CSF55) TaxID=988480 RepID=A0A4P9YIG2_ROZAC|nr:phosphatases II [Rozella allomycis CSF55]